METDLLSKPFCSIFVFLDWKKPEQESGFKCDRHCQNLAEFK
jgi:hypothetical protein